MKKGGDTYKAQIAPSDDAQCQLLSKSSNKNSNNAKQRSKLEELQQQNTRVEGVEEKYLEDHVCPIPTFIFIIRTPAPNL